MIAAALQRAAEADAKLPGTGDCDDSRESMHAVVVVVGDGEAIVRRGCWWWRWCRRSWCWRWRWRWRRRRRKARDARRQCGSGRVQLRRGSFVGEVWRRKQRLRNLSREGAVTLVLNEAQILVVLVAVADRLREPILQAQKATQSIQEGDGEQALTLSLMEETGTLCAATVGVRRQRGDRPLLHSRLQCRRTRTRHAR